MTIREHLISAERVVGRVQSDADVLAIVERARDTWAERPIWDRWLVPPAERAP